MIFICPRCVFTASDPPAVFRAIPIIGVNAVNGQVIRVSMVQRPRLERLITVPFLTHTNALAAVQIVGSTICIAAPLHPPLDVLSRLAFQLFSGVLHRQAFTDEEVFVCFYTIVQVYPGIEIHPGSVFLCHLLRGYDAFTHNTTPLLDISCVSQLYICLQNRCRCG